MHVSRDMNDSRDINDSRDVNVSRDMNVSRDSSPVSREIGRTPIAGGAGWARWSPSARPRESAPGVESRRSMA